MTCARRLAGARTPAPSTSADSGRPDARTGCARARRLSLPLPVLALLAGMLSLFAAAPVDADHGNIEQTTLVSNLGESTRTGGSGLHTSVTGQTFTTGRLSSFLQSVEVLLQVDLPSGVTALTAAERAKIRAELWSADNNGKPDAKLYDLTIPTNIRVGVDANARAYAFSAPPNAQLNANTAYSVLWYTTDGAVLNVSISGTDSHDDDTAASGWSIADDGFWKSGNSPAGGNFGTGFRVKIRVNGREENKTGLELESAAFLPGGAEGHDLVIPEGGSATFGVRLSTQPAANVTVNLGKLVAQPLDATPEEFHASVDAVNAVTVSPETLTFTPANWSALQTVTVTTTVDGDAEHEHVIVYAQLADGGHWANGVYVTVTDPGNAPQVGAQPASGRESGDGTGIDIPIAFWLRPASSSPVTVRYRTADGTATAGSDYTATSGTVAFAAGETSKTVNVRILDDTVEDSGETFFVELSNPSGATIAPHYDRVRVTILNDETGEFTVTLADNSGGGAPTPTHNNNGGNNDETDELAAAPADNGNADSGSSGSGGGFRSPSDPSSRAALSDLVVTPRDEDGNPGKRLALSPAFAPSATAYTLDVPYTTGALDIAPGLTGGTAALGTRSGGTTSIFPAAQSYRVSLPPGETTVVEVTVTAEDGSRTRTYTLRVTRAAPDTDPSLPALVVRGNDDSDINLSPAFSPDNTDYQASLSRHVNELTLTFPHHKGSITVNTVPVPPGGALSLPAGTPAITIDSTAQDGASTLQYTIALQRTGLPADLSRSDLAEMALSLADATSRSIARRLDNRRAGTGPGLTARIRSLFPDTAVEPTSFDPVFETARVDNGWERSNRLPGLNSLLPLADTAWSFDEDNPDAPGLWFEGSALVGQRMDSAHAGFDAVTGHHVTAGAALSWHEASFNNNNDTALAGINPYLRWRGENTTLDVASGLSKGHFRHEGNGNGYREPVEHNYLRASFAGHLLQRDNIEIALRSEMTRAQLAVGPVSARAGRMRLAVESSATLELPGDSRLVPSLSVGARRDHGDLAGAGVGVESGASLTWQGGNLSLSARTRLFRTALDTEWGIGAALDYRHPRGTFVTLSPSYGNAQDSFGQLWDRGLPRAGNLQADGYAPHTQDKQLRADLRAGFAWQAPHRSGRLEPFVEARLQRRPSLRLGAHWTAPGGLTLRLAGERTGGAAGLPADNALLLEAGWRPGR